VYAVAQRDAVRIVVLVEGHTQREAARHFHMSRNTVAKLLAEPAEGSERRYQRQRAPHAPVSAGALPYIRGWLHENEWLQRWQPKQQWTAQRLWLELERLGIPAGASTVRQLVRREREQTQQERRATYVPLAFGPGERAEFDFGEAAVEVAGQYAYRRRVLKADPFHVRLYADDALVATQPRSYAKGEVIEEWRHYVRVLLEKPFALPCASAMRHALQTGELPSHWEQLRQDLVARRSDGNREFARILELAAMHPLAAVDGALLLAAERPDWNADTVRHLLAWLKDPCAPVAPRVAGRYPAYQLTLPLPALQRYSRLLEVRS
jgi:transposase